MADADVSYQVDDVGTLHIRLSRPQFDGEALVARASLTRIKRQSPAVTAQMMEEKFNVSLRRKGFQAVRYRELQLIAAACADAYQEAVPRKRGRIITPEGFQR